jgi:TRAP-type C4-dicarboxylate transport system substrate-binding protein
MFRSVIPLLAALALFSANTAHSQSLELKLGHSGTPGSIQDLAASEFASRFNRELSGRASVSVHGESRLGADTELLKKLKTGEVPLAIVAAPMSSVADEFGIFDMPFLVRNRAHLKLFRRPLMQKHLQPAALVKGYRVLAMWDLGTYQIANNTRPIKVPGDLGGLKFRAPNAAWRIRMLQSYGVQAVPFEIKDIYPALQSGTLDGLELPPPALGSPGIPATQKYLSLTGHLYSPAFLLIGEEQFQKLPPGVRDALLRHAEAIQDWSLERGEELEARWLAIAAKTMTVNEADRLAFTLAALPIYREFAGKVPAGKAMIRLVFRADPNPFISAAQYLPGL